MRAAGLEMGAAAAAVTTAPTQRLVARTAPLRRVLLLRAVMTRTQTQMATMAAMAAVLGWAARLCDGAVFSRARASHSQQAACLPLMQRRAVRVMRMVCAATER